MLLPVGPLLAHTCLAGTAISQAPGRNNTLVQEQKLLVLTLFGSMRAVMKHMRTPLPVEFLLAVVEVPCCCTRRPACASEGT
jgi:hypothetical protein